MNPFMGWVFPIVRAVTLISIVMICGSLLGAEASTKKGGTTTAVAVVKEVEAPVGFWSDSGTELYVLVEARKGEAGVGESEWMIAGGRRLELGGPPPRKGRADDVFFPEKFERKGNTIVASGTFNWDTAKNAVEVEISWTATGVTLKVVKNAGYYLGPVGTYVLKKQKR